MKEDNQINVLEAVDQAKESIKTSQKSQGLGIITASGDGVVKIANLPGAKLGELVRIIENEAFCMVMQMDQQEVLGVILNHGQSVRPGNTVELTGQIAGINVSENLLGRVVDPLGEALDELGQIQGGVQMPLESPAPGVMDRQPVSVPLQTGILSIDALVPIGRGQRELIIGDRQTGKTTIAIDTILNQKDQGVLCVYVAIGQREGKLSQVIKTLKDNGALSYTVVVSASSNSPAALQYLAPYAGVAVAEYFCRQGKDVLIVYDDLSKHAASYREISLLLRKPPGREAYPGDVFYIHSRLLERSARLSEAKGGGSITALPIVETQAADVSAYIPTNIISITDGQIFLEPKLFYKGIRPAINVGISVSRVGGAAQTKAMKKTAGQAKLFLAQYAELAAFAQFASELDEESKKQLARGEILTESLKQKPGAPYLLWQEVLILFATTGGFLDKLKGRQVTEAIQKILELAPSKLSQEITSLQQNPTLTPETEKAFSEFLTQQFT